MSPVRIGAYLQHNAMSFAKVELRGTAQYRSIGMGFSASRTAKRVGMDLAVIVTVTHERGFQLRDLVASKKGGLSHYPHTKVYSDRRSPCTSSSTLENGVMTRL